LALEPGLYLVATPIGNLEDITLRALRVLKETRQTQKLLNHFAISTPTVSYHEHNEQSRSVELVARLKEGGSIAVVTDAGTPAFSDPGLELVRAAVAAGVRVFPVPGANAAVSALVASGLNTQQVFFVGFPESKAGARRTELEALATRSQGWTLVFYEAPHRILETLADVEAVWGEVQVVVARELTKLHEEFLRGTAREVREQLGARDRVRGEMVLLIDGASISAAEKPAGSVRDQVSALVAGGLDEKEALKQIARERGVSKSEVYRELQRTRSKTSR
jgi:16S rRNA (cytidine1402-2'-O)-methyltransferase